MTIVTSSGLTVVPGTRLAGGGQAEVFALVSRPGFVFKRYLRQALADDPRLERRLRIMVAQRPAEWREPRTGHMTLAWPDDLVFDNGRFAGFLMPQVDMGRTVELHRVTNPSDRRTATGASAWAQGFNWRYLVRTASNLAHATTILHDAQTVIGDFNERNIRVSHETRVTLLDCDSMQISDPASGERFFTGVGRPEFTPPEMLNADWSKTVRHPSSDLFALAIHLYQLLLEGEHPFRGTWSGAGDKPSVPELARRGVWAHQQGGPLSPRRSAIGIDLLPDAIADMFQSAFEAGAVRPAARPTALHWQHALSGLDRQLRRCASNPEHWYRATRKTCPWCLQAVAARTSARLLPSATAASSRPQATGPAWRSPASGAPRQPSRTQVFLPPSQQHPGPARRRPSRRTALIAAITGIAAAVSIVVGSLAGGPAAPGATSFSRPAHSFADPGNLGVDALAFSPDGRVLATGDADGSTYLWLIAGGARIGAVPCSDTGVGYNRGVAFSPDGRTLATSDADGSTCLWNVATSRRLGTIGDPGADSVTSAAFSPDGKTLATADANGSTYLWNVATGRRLGTIGDPGAGGVTSVAFSPDGKTLATADANGSTYLWDVATRRESGILGSPSAYASTTEAVAFSPDGKTLATAEANGSTSLWNVATGHKTDTFRGAFELDAAAFSPDGHILATGSAADGTVLWNVTTGRKITALIDARTAYATVTTVQFSPDGKTLASGYSDGQTYLWRTARAGR